MRGWNKALRSEWRHAAVLSVWEPSMIGSRRNETISSCICLGSMVQWLYNAMKVRSTRRWFPFLTQFFLCPLHLELRLKNKSKCPSIFYTLLPSRMHAHTSWRGLFSLPTLSSWILSARDAFKLPQSSATPKPLFSAEIAILCSANQQAERPDSPRDALTERRLTKLF